MPYTIKNAIQDEVDFLREMAKVEDKSGKIIVARMYESIANSHQRILNRMRGADYSLEIVDGEIKSVRKMSNRKTLEEEYPALKKAAEQYDLVQNLVDASPKSDSNE